MATLFDRGGRRDRAPLSTLMPTSLVALVGNDLVNRGARQARAWLEDRMAARDGQKRKALSKLIPFYPSIPLVPLVVVTGLTTFSSLVAVRMLRQDREIRARLEAIEAELARLKGSAPRAASVGSETPPAEAAAAEEAKTLESEPATLPWS